MFPIKHVRGLDLLDGTLEGSPEQPHTFRGTLISLQECEIARYTPNQLEMKPISHSLAP